MRSLARAIHVARSDAWGTAPLAPTLLFEAGSGADHSVWRPVIERLSGRFRWIAYDRPGIGRSASLPGPRDPLTMAEQLAALLDTLGEQRPVVVVAHSLGTMIARCLLLRAPARVAGLVLLDPVHEDMHSRLAPPSDPALPQRLVRRAIVAMRGASLFARLGLLGLYFRLRPQAAWRLGLTGRERRDIALLGRAARWRDMAASLRDFDTGAAFVRGQPFPSVPTVVLTAVGHDNAMQTMSGRPHADFVTQWRGLHDEIASATGGQREDVEAPHAIQLAAPDRVVAAIEQVVTQVMRVPATKETNGL